MKLGKDMKDKIEKIIKNTFVDDNGKGSFRNRLMWKLIKENLTITYSNHWYTVRICDDTLKIYCNQRYFAKLEKFAWNKTILKQVKPQVKQHFKKELSPERKQYFEQLNQERQKIRNERYSKDC